ncbi:MAG: zinc metallopeptidase [Clostridia bacterium]|nr:zinc metallopeptidase [Clostridia bacterium]
MDLLIIILASLSLPLFFAMIFVSISVKTTFSKYNQTSASCGLSAKEVARRILDANGLYTVQIASCSGVLSDHYDPRNNTVYLSSATINSNSIAAISVAAHEVGHAIQHADDYAPIKFRSALVPIVNFASKLITPFLILGILFEFIAVFSVNVSSIFYLIAFVCYAIYCLFTLVTLPCEYNASRRAKDQLSDLGFLADDEIAISSKVLGKAAQTYLLSFLYSLAQLARILLMLLSSKRNNRR